MIGMDVTFVKLLVSHFYPAMLCGIHHMTRRFFFQLSNPFTAKWLLILPLLFASSCVCGILAVNTIIKINQSNYLHWFSDKRWQTSDCILAVHVKIWTEHLQNRRLEFYSYAKLLGALLINACWYVLIILYLTLYVSLFWLLLRQRREESHTNN
jgi:hypothetical protein